jgi:hypothetical protein
MTVPKLKRKLSQKQAYALAIKVLKVYAEPKNYDAEGRFGWGGKQDVTASNGFDGSYTYKTWYHWHHADIYARNALALIEGKPLNDYERREILGDKSKCSHLDPRMAQLFSEVLEFVSSEGE